MLAVPLALVSRCAVDLDFLHCLSNRVRGAHDVCMMLGSHQIITVILCFSIRER